MKIVITCLHNDTQWKGIFYDKARVQNFLKRLRAKEGVTNIEILEEGVENESFSRL